MLYGKIKNINKKISKIILGNDVKRISKCNKIMGSLF